MPATAHTEVDLRDVATIDRVVTALTSPMELRETLSLIAGMARDLVGASRCTVFLVEGNQIRPAVSVSRSPDPVMGALFRSMDPIDIDPVSWGLLALGQPVVIDDAQTSHLVPPGWAEAFQLSAVALLPCMAEEPCGLLAAEKDDGASFTDDELDRLRAVASYVARAVAHAKPFDSVARRVRLSEALARSAAALAEPLEHDAIARRLVRAYSDLLGARLCAIGLVDQDRSHMTTVDSINTKPLAPLPLTDIPDHIVTSLWEAWAVTKRPMRMGDDPWLAEFLGSHRVGVDWYLLVPMLNHGHTLGAVLLGFSSSTTIEADEIASAEALAALAAAAFERHALLTRLDQQLRRLDALYRASSALTEGATAKSLVHKLNQLLAEHGFEIISIAFRDRTLARHYGGDDPTPEERGIWRTNGGSVALADGTLAVPMRAGRRLVGTLRIRPVTNEPDQRSFLEALASGLADVTSRSALRAEVEQAERERAVTAERERLAADLHDSAGQLFVALGLLARRLADTLPDETTADQARRLATLADQGREEIVHVLRALTFVPAARRGLAPSVQELAASLAADSGLVIDVEVLGAAARLPSVKEQALFRVAHEALANAWRHAHCDRVRVELRFEAHEVVLRVEDDGVGLGDGPSRDGLHLGVNGMKRVMTEVGGTVELGDGVLRGAVVLARVPRADA